MLGALVPNALVRVSARRGRLVGERIWISDEKAFAAFIVGAIISLSLYNFFSTFFVSIVIMTMPYWPAVDALLLVAYFVIFKKLILGR
jgi:hypothetical protein